MEACRHHHDCSTSKELHLAIARQTNQLAPHREQDRIQDLRENRMTKHYLFETVKNHNKTLHRRASPKVSRIHGK